MDNLQTLTTFLGWCSVINIAALCLATLALTLMRGPVIRIHSRLLGVSQADLPMAYMYYLSNYKIGIVMLNIVPYLALILMR
jgi:hypothetical protein